MTNVWDIVKAVGSAVISEAVPGGGLVLDAINYFLDDDKKLPLTATGAQAQAAIKALSPEQQSALLAKQLDVKIEDIRQSHDTLRTMLDADKDNPQTTRPWIAKWAFVFTALFSGVVGAVVIGAYAYAVGKQDVELVKAIMDGWPFVLAVLTAVTGTFSLLLRAYFGMLSKEHECRVGAATGNYKPSAMSGLIAAMRPK
ncbi:hypothetical protein [Vibrio phage VP16T]|nr:hypothetical protein [Vibrio phage VP16T]